MIYIKLYFKMTSGLCESKEACVVHRSFHCKLYYFFICEMKTGNLTPIQIDIWDVSIPTSNPFSTFLHKPFTFHTAFNTCMFLTFLTDSMLFNRFNLKSVLVCESRLRWVWNKFVVYIYILHNTKSLSFVVKNVYCSWIMSVD